MASFAMLTVNVNKGTELSRAVTYILFLILVIAPNRLYAQGFRAECSPCVPEFSLGRTHLAILLLF